MPKISKPDMSNVWAEGGSVAVVPSEKISQGWVVEIPPCEQMNFVQNRQDAGIAYMLQQGIPEWDSSTEYQAVTSYAQFGGVVYKATGTSTNKSPVTFPEFWEKAFDNAGSAQIVQDQLDAIEADDDPFDQYLLKTRATANGIDAELALTNRLTNTNLNIVDGVGEYYIDSSCTNKPFNFGVMKVSIEFTGRGVYQMVQSTTSEGIATRFRGNNGAWTVWAYSVTNSTPVDLSALQAQVTALTAAIEATKIKIGDIFFTTIDFLSSTDVAAHLGYGSWHRYAEGYALVGRSAQPLAPAWTQSINNGYGEYTHTLSNSEMPLHSHSTDPFNYFVAKGTSVANSTTTGVDSSYPTTEIAIGNLSSDNWNMAREKSSGGSQPFSIVQPSVVVGVWYRTA